MYELNIKVRNKIAAQTDKAEYVCGNSDYIAVFDFDSEWDAYDTKTARFSYNGSYTDVVFDGNQCPVPVITDTHCFHIGVYAGDLHTTTAARVPCRKSILCGGGSPAAPSEDVYNQLMQRMSELETPDWNQNDSTKKDYIKNRTHWTSPMTFSVGEHSFDYWGYLEDFQPSIGDNEKLVFKAAASATIVLDGETYECPSGLDSDSDVYAVFYPPDYTYDADDDPRFILEIDLIENFLYFWVNCDSYEEVHTFSASFDALLVRQFDRFFSSGCIVSLDPDNNESPYNRRSFTVWDELYEDYVRIGDVYSYEGRLKARIPSDGQRKFVVPGSFGAGGYPHKIGYVCKFTGQEISSYTIARLRESYRPFIQVSLIKDDKNWFNFAVELTEVSNSSGSTTTFIGVFSTIDNYLYRVAIDIDPDDIVNYNKNPPARCKATISICRLL